MIYISKIDNLHIKVDVSTREYIKDLKEHFSSYVEGYQYTPKYKLGYWNGKICMYNSVNKSLPYGLLTDLIHFHKKNYPDEKISVSDDVKALFKGNISNIKYDLNLKPRYYQKDTIEVCLKYSKGIIKSATASGKSLVIAYIIKNLLRTKQIKQSLIVVPNINLVQQFYKDLIEYGIKEDLIGKVYLKFKEFNKPIVVSTWQSLMRNHDKLKKYQCVIIDEVHSARSLQIQKILQKCPDAPFRFGFTGTLPTNNIDIWNVQSYLGPVLKEYNSNELAEQGFISKCNINIINIEYHNEFKGDYNKIKDSIFINSYRLSVIKNIVESVDKNILLLVGKVDKEGKVLEDFFNNNPIKDREVVFIYGDTKADVREYWRDECEKRNNIILIATYGVYQVGVNIKSLMYIILAAPFKSKIRVIQSIGRGLRKHEDKIDGAVIWDIIDNTKYFEDHGNKRLRHYNDEEFHVTEQLYNEGDDINILP